MNRFLRLVSCLAAVCMLATFAGVAKAQDDYPNKPVRLIVPFSPGGGSDFLARLVGQELSKIWGQPVVVENRPGANAIIGTEILANSPPDGYTILLQSLSHVINPSLTKLPFDTAKDFAAVSTVTASELVLAVHPAVPANTLQEFIALAKSKPGEINYGSGGIGNPNQLAGELFNMKAGVKLTHVPYKGGGEAITDLVGGHVQVFFAVPGAVVSLIESGKLKAYAVSGDQRLQALPDLPTFTEAGLADFKVRQWYGILAPAGTPDAILNKIHEGLAEVVSMPDVKTSLVNHGMDPFITTPSEFTAIINADLIKFADIIKTADIKLTE